MSLSLYNNCTWQVYFHVHLGHQGKGKTCMHVTEREHSKEKTYMTQTVYLLNLETHSFFQILYTLLPSLRISILLHSSFFSFLIFWFQVCFSSLHPNWNQFHFSHYTASASIWHHSSVTFPPFPLLCSALYMFSLAFFYLENFLHHSWIKLFKSFSINNLNEKRTFNKIKIIGLKGENLKWNENEHWMQYNYIKF